MKNYKNQRVYHLHKPVYYVPLSLELMDCSTDDVYIQQIDVRSVFTHLVTVL